MQQNQLKSWRMLALAALCGSVLAGCSGRDADLQRFIDATRKEPGGRVEPLPEIKPYDSYVYSAGSLRSPFVPGGSRGAASGPRPDNRNHEFLEQFSLDTLKMVGTLKLNGQNYGLVQVADGRVQRVLVGNHLGQNEGRITDIAPNKISLIELVP
ncbi:MAG: pilus assembly protein PilP, partial [Gammaproteobacteria bacterium]|nr:pilus assembly protein PilP [Gammaproteobacteria bacterium]